ncbi:acetamidase/formamidase family protein [uncultured Martelella sp.]|uniref:acetamidase/formamidase family protein n=1 Tax=uncultured Martelella sp. TaxID=392331 RepID=UPI0029C99FAD|nr:acetamidase/formamidase family protein [uncultured Martelella sp.]
MTAHELKPSADTVHWGFLDGSLAPVLEVASGDTVTVHSLSGAPEEVPSQLSTLRPEHADIHARLSPSPGPHILTGPISVREAMTGDVLKVEILDIALRERWGYNITRPGRGTLPDDFLEPHTRHFEIDPEAGSITLPWGGTLQANPFFGIIAAAPRPQDGRLTSVIPGYFGGNLDCRELTAGSTLYLPVSVAGALISIGDGHASQGDGEACLTAVETGLTGRFRFTVLKVGSLEFPYAATPSHLITMGVDENLEEAVRLALRRAIAQVSSATGISAAEAYTLCSIAADIRITQLVNVKKGVHVMIPKAVLQQAAND